MGFKWQTIYLMKAFVKELMRGAMRFFLGWELKTLEVKNELISRGQLKGDGSIKFG